MLAYLAAGALAANTPGLGIYNSPILLPFVTVEVQARLPNNVTTPDGIVSTSAIPSGNITGRFTGELVAELSYETEKFLPYTDGVFTVSLTVSRKINRLLTILRLLRPCGFLRMARMILSWPGWKERRPMQTMPSMDLALRKFPFEALNNKYLHRC